MTYANDEAKFCVEIRKVPTKITNKKFIKYNHAAFTVSGSKFVARRLSRQSISPIPPWYIIELPKGTDIVPVS